MIVTRGLIALITVGVMASVAMAQESTNKEPLLLQVVDDLSRSRQQAEIDRAACQVQVKELQQKLQDAKNKDTSKKDAK